MLVVQLAAKGPREATRWGHTSRKGLYDRKMGLDKMTNIGRFSYWSSNTELPPRLRTEQVGSRSLSKHKLQILETLWPLAKLRDWWDVRSCWTSSRAQSRREPSIVLAKPIAAQTHLAKLQGNQKEHICHVIFQSVPLMWRRTSTRRFKLLAKSKRLQSNTIYTTKTWENDSINKTKLAGHSFPKAYENNTNMERRRKKADQISPYLGNEQYYNKQSNRRKEKFRSIDVSLPCIGGLFYLISSITNLVRASSQAHGAGEITSSLWNSVR